MNKIDRLKKLYKQAEKLNDEFPKELVDKLSLYGQILEIIGGLHAEAVKAWKLAEANRREVIAAAIAYGAELEGVETPKTAKEREAAAEVVGAEARKRSLG